MIPGVISDEFGKLVHCHSVFEGFGDVCRESTGPDMLPNSLGNVDGQAHRVLLATTHSPDATSGSIASQGQSSHGRVVQACDTAESAPRKRYARAAAHSNAMTQTPILAIEAEGLVKVFGQQRAVDGISLAVPHGTVLGVLGPNGAGKTTTIRMLATLLRPDAGNARIFGYDVRTQTTAVRSLIGVTGQYACVDETLTATENLVIFGRLLGLSRKATRRRAAELLEEFDLTEAADKPLQHFSGGMRRRLDLAASLIATPPLLFLDEPTTGLDPRTRLQMWQTIRRLVSEGATVLLTTQYLDEADQLADRIAVIDHGKVIAEGTSDELKGSVGSATLHLTLADASCNDSARAIVTEFLSRATGTPVEVTAAAGGLTAPLHDPNATAELLIKLRDNNIRLDAVTVNKPSLDEVFFALTGHSAETETATTNSRRAAA